MLPVITTKKVVFFIESLKCKTYHCLFISSKPNYVHVKKKKLQNKVKENDNKTFNIADFS